MSGYRTFAILLTLAAASAPAAAESYKWVDEKGVVNYSNTPPPEKFSKAKVVGERLSIVSPDPSFARAVAAMNARMAQRAQYEEADWQMRQRYLLATRASTYPGSAYGTGYDPYAVPYYPPVYGPVFISGARRFRTTTFFMHR